MLALYRNFVEDWERKKDFEELEIMINSGQQGKKISFICIFLGQATPVARLFQIIFENMSEWSRNDVYKNYTLYIDAYIPYNWNYTPVFEITCLIEYIGTLMAALSYSGTDGLFSEIAFHLSGQYHILRLKLLDIVNRMNQNTSWIDIDKTFSNVVDNHERINRFLHFPAIIYIFFILYITGRNNNQILEISPESISFYFVFVYCTETLMIKII